jgi:hypothetical protein
MRMMKKFLLFNFYFEPGRRWPAGPAQNSKFKTKNLSRARRDGQHLAAFVKATGRTHAVRHRRRVALLAFAQLRKLEHTVVSPAHTLPAR